LLDYYRDYLLRVATDELASDLVPKVSPSDLVQETFLQAAVDFPRFIGASEAELRSWLRQILLNNLRDAARFCGAQKRNWKLEVSLADESPVARPAEEIRSPQPTPSEAFVTAENARTVQLALQTLSANDRRVIEMRSFEGLQFAQVGQRLGVSSEAARKLWARAVDRLAEALHGIESHG
jgi:RNA polymerase sigma-70 factor (ECF subfamily)